MGTHEGRRRNRSIASQVRRAVASVLGDLSPWELSWFVTPITLGELAAIPNTRTLKGWLDVLAKAEAANWIHPFGHEWLITGEGRMVLEASRMSKEVA